MQEFPLLKSLKERIYLGTEVITKMEHEYIFTKRCWATPSVDSEMYRCPFMNPTIFFSSNIAYSPIIDNGCPSDAFTALQARLNHEDRFSTETLRFPESNYVYIQAIITVFRKIESQCVFSSATLLSATCENLMLRVQ